MYVFNMAFLGDHVYIMILLINQNVFLVNEFLSTFLKKSQKMFCQNLKCIRIDIP